MTTMLAVIFLCVLVALVAPTSAAGGQKSDSKVTSSVGGVNGELPCVPSPYVPKNTQQLIDLTPVILKGTVTEVGQMACPANGVVQLNGKNLTRPSFGDAFVELECIYAEQGTDVSLTAHTVALVTGFGDEQDCLSPVAKGDSVYIFVQPTQPQLLSPARRADASPGSLCKGNDCSAVFPDLASVCPGPLVVDMQVFKARYDDVSSAVMPVGNKDLEEMIATSFSKAVSACATSSGGGSRWSSSSSSSSASSSSSSSQSSYSSSSSSRASSSSSGSPGHGRQTKSTRATFRSTGHARASASASASDQADAGQSARELLAERLETTSAAAASAERVISSEDVQGVASAKLETFAGLRVPAGRRPFACSGMPNMTMFSSPGCTNQQSSGWYMNPDQFRCTFATFPYCPTSLSWGKLSDWNPYWTPASVFFLSQQECELVCMQPASGATTSNVQATAEATAWTEPAASRKFLNPGDQANVNGSSTFSSRNGSLVQACSTVSQTVVGQDGVARTRTTRSGNCTDATAAHAAFRSAQGEPFDVFASGDVVARSSPNCDGPPHLAAPSASSGDSSASACAGALSGYYFVESQGTCEYGVFTGCPAAGQPWPELWAAQSDCEKACTMPAKAAMHTGPEIKAQTAPPVADVPLACQGMPVVATYAGEAPCTTQISGWYYEPILDVCIDATFTGCPVGAPVRLFGSQSDCEGTCKPKAQAFKSPSCMYRTAVRGPCNEAVPRWTFSAATGACSRFQYTCLGGPNNFADRESCNAACVPSASAAAPSSLTGAEERLVCTLPPSAGPCNAYVPRYAYDPSTGLCRPFVYGGCGGNRNSFASMAECMAACA